VDYPQTMSFYSGHPDLQKDQLSFIPICDDTTVACFQYNGTEYKGTNLEGAGFSVNVLRETRNLQDCAKIDTGSFPIKTETIHGTPFHYGETGEVATGHSTGGPTYRAFHEGVCFEITAWIAATNLGVFDPGTVKGFDSTKLNKLLDRMVHTFRFVGTVRDGAGWHVYRDSSCGGMYEYPDEATVRTTVEYSQARFYSNEITCAQSFTYQGLEYTVAYKTNLNGLSKADAWLTSSGYPGLDNAQIISKSGIFTEYRAGSYEYVIGQAGVYILSVSDANHKVIAPHDDRVFTHWLNSFKAR
jgi:hypothetical protein